MGKKSTACVTVDRKLLESARLSTCNPVTNEPYTQLAVCHEAGFSGDTQYQRALGNKRNQGVRYETLSLIVEAIQRLGGFKPKLNPEDFVASVGRKRPRSTQMAESTKAADRSREFRSAVPVQIDLFLTANFCADIRPPTLLSMDLLQVAFNDGRSTSLNLSESNQRLAIAIANSFMSAAVNRIHTGHKKFYQRELKRLSKNRHDSSVCQLCDLFNLSEIMTLDSLYSEAVESSYFTGNLKQTIGKSITIVTKVRATDQAAYTTATTECIASIIDSFDVATGFLRRPEVHLCTVDPVAYARWYTELASSAKLDSHMREFIQNEILRALKLLSYEDRNALLSNLMFAEDLAHTDKCCRIRICSPLLTKAVRISANLIKDILLSLLTCEHSTQSVIDEAYTLLCHHESRSRSMEDDDPYRSFTTELVRSIAQMDNWQEVENLLLASYLTNSDSRYHIGCLLASVESKLFFSNQFNHKEFFKEFERLPEIDQAKWLFVVLRDLMQNHEKKSMQSTKYQFELLDGLLTIAESHQRYSGLALWAASWIDNTRLPPYFNYRSLSQCVMDRVKQLIISDQLDRDSIGYAALLYSKEHVCSHHTAYARWIGSVIAVTDGQLPHIELQSQKSYLPVVDSDLIERLLAVLALPDLSINVGWAVVLSLGRMGVYSARCLDILESATEYVLALPDRLELSIYLGLLGTRKAKAILARITSTSADWTIDLGICGLRLTADIDYFEAQMLKGDNLCVKYALGIAGGWDRARAVEILAKHLESDNAKIANACQAGLTFLDAGERDEFGDSYKTIANRCFVTPRAFLIGNFEK